MNENRREREVRLPFSKVERKERGEIASHFLFFFPARREEALESSIIDYRLLIDHRSRRSDLLLITKTIAKKRNKSKGKTTAKEKQAEVAKQQQKLLEEQIDALQISDDSTSNNDAAAADRGVEKNGNVKNDCKHGLPSLSMHKSASLKCMRTFTEEFNAATKRYGNVDRAYSEAFDAAKEYREVSLERFHANEIDRITLCGYWDASNPRWK